MAVTRAEKESQLQALEGALKGVETAILVDYRGLDVPQVTELRRQLRAVKAQYKVVKNTLARRAVKGTPFEALDKHFEGTTAVAYTGGDPVALATTLTTFAKTAPAGVVKAAVIQGGRGHRTGDAAGQAGAVRQAAVPAAGPDGAAGQRAECGAARFADGADPGREEEERERERVIRISRGGTLVPAFKSRIQEQR